MNNGKRHSLQIKKLAQRLRQKGKTHREIRTICRISLASAHLWTKGIMLSQEQKNAIGQRRYRALRTHDRREKLQVMARKNLGKIWEANAYSKEELLKKIIDFYHQEWRIPLKREFNMYRVYQEQFGSWNDAIQAAGLKPNAVIFSKKFIANDGHICDSFSEKIIDDYLSSSAMKHERNTYYEGTKMSADFLIGDMRIEYFGLAGVNRTYDQIIHRKRAAARKYKFRLLEIYPSALFAPGFKDFFIKNLKKWTKK